jgi:4-amino-4-deoxy-L-arabinose transferase-like glycosyltransferase
MGLQSETRQRFLLGLILLLAIAVRLYHLSWYSISRDEAFTWLFSQRSLAYSWTTGMRIETNPPGYFSFMHVWMALCGHSETALRLPSAIASFGAVGLVYALGRELLGKPAALVGALIMALAPIELWYAQEARAYAFLQLFVGASLFCLARFLSRPPAPAWLAGYAVATTGAIYSHDTALVYVAACNFAVLVSAWGRRALITPRQLGGWLLANLAVGLAALPLVMDVRHQTHLSNIAWIDRPGLAYCSQCLVEVIGGTAVFRETTHHHEFIVMSVTLLAMGAALWNAPRLDRRSAAVLLSVPIGFFILVLGISLHRPIFISRIFIWTWIPLSLLLAHVLCCRGWLRLPLLYVTAWLMAYGLTAQLHPRAELREGWGKLVQANREEFSRAQLVVLVPRSSYGPIIYYAPDIVPRLSHLSLYPLASLGLIQRNEIESFRIPPIDIDELVAAIKAGKRVCLVQSRSDTGYLPGLLKQVPPPTRNFETKFQNKSRSDILSWGD